jgi:prepilin-type N-terminal cleavage/methylation domain-containing protein
MKRKKGESKMKKFLRVFHGNEKGFTLIELLVVVSILGALAAVVALNVGSFIGKGQQESACTERQVVQTAVVAYMASSPGSTPTIALARTYLISTESGEYTVSASGKVTQTEFPKGNAAGKCIK